MWGGPRKVLRMDNGPDFISSVLQQSRRDRIGISWIPPGTPRNIGHTGSFNNRLRKECLNRNQSGHSKRQRGSKTSRTATTTDICTDPRLLDGRRVRCTAHLHGRDRGCEFDRHQSHRGLETRWSDCRGPATRTSNRAMDIVSRVTPVPIDAAVQPRFMHRACRVSGANATIGQRPRAVTRSRESPLRFEPRPTRRSGLRPPFPPELPGVTPPVS